MNFAEELKNRQAAILKSREIEEQRAIEKNQKELDKRIAEMKKSYDATRIKKILHNYVTRVPDATEYFVTIYTTDSKWHHGKEFTDLQPVIDHIINIAKLMGLQAQICWNTNYAGGGSDPYYNSDSYELGVTFKW
jgi:hypothetical protein